jgi:hypothetical protein
MLGGLFWRYNHGGSNELGIYLAHSVLLKYYVFPWQTIQYVLVLMRLLLGGISLLRGLGPTYRDRRFSL